MLLLPTRDPAVSRPFLTLTCHSLDLLPEDSPSNTMTQCLTLFGLLHPDRNGRQDTAIHSNGGCLTLWDSRRIGLPVIMAARPRWSRTALGQLTSIATNARLAMHERHSAVRLVRLPPHEPPPQKLTAVVPLAAGACSQQPATSHMTIAACTKLRCKRLPCCPAANSRVRPATLHQVLRLMGIACS